MFCPQCKAEYRAGFTRCSDCGVMLLFRLPSEPRPIFAESDALEDELELVSIRTYNTQIDVELAKSALEAAGIESIIRSGDFGGRESALSSLGGIELLVRSEDAADADQILRLDVGEE